MAKAVSKASKDSGEVKATILALNVLTVDIPIRGTSPLIMNRFSDEAIDGIRKKQEGMAQLPKGPKDPQACFRTSCHLMPGSSWEDKNPRFGFPAVAFKRAMVDAAKDMGMAMTDARRTFHVCGSEGGLVELRFRSLRMRSDPVSNKKGIDIRHRGEFSDWSCTLRIRYNASVVTAEQVANLLNAAGFGVGVGAWRPKGFQSTGTFGMFEVVTKKSA